ncbi:MAG: hypothetical protein RIT45_3729 [Pseudomonadota bacterium]
MIARLWRRLRRWWQRAEPHGVRLPPWPTLSLGPGLRPEDAAELARRALAEGPPSAEPATRSARTAEARAGRAATRTARAAAQTAQGSAQAAAHWLAARPAPETRTFGTPPALRAAPVIRLAGPTQHDRRRAEAARAAGRG